MRIKIFADPNCMRVEKAVNNWIIENEDEFKILDIIYRDNGIHFSVLIKYQR